MRKTPQQAGSSYVPRRDHPPMAVRRGSAYRAPRATRGVAMPGNDHLTALDAAFLELEQADGGALMHTPRLCSTRSPAVGRRRSGRCASSSNSAWSCCLATARSSARPAPADSPGRPGSAISARGRARGRDRRRLLRRRGDVRVIRRSRRYARPRCTQRRPRHLSGRACGAGARDSGGTLSDRPRSDRRLRSSPLRLCADPR